MGFVGVARAIYDFQPTGENELEIQEGDLLFILEKTTGDDWWKAKKKAKDEDDEEPEGLIPFNYVEEAPPLSYAKALYDYSRQTDEELSFSEETALEIYDTSDPEWTLVGLHGEYGFAPTNYIELSDAAPAKPTRPVAAREAEPKPEPEDEYDQPRNPAAEIANIIQQRTGSSATGTPRTAHQSVQEASDEEQPVPSLPRRPPSEQMSPPATQYASPRSPDTPGISASSPRNRQVGSFDEGLQSPGGYHLYNIHEMISHMGKNKKMPTTLGINLARGIIMIAPEKSRDGPQKEWTAEKLTHYSIEGKHVFMELVRPSKSIDFHAGAKDTATEIVSSLGELAGAARAGGLREVLDAATGTGQKKGHMMFEFMAQGEDEVTVAEGDEVIVLDDTKSDEWWMVKRLKNGKQGVVPSNFIEVTGVVESRPDPGLAAARATVEQNRLDEEKQARDVVKAGRKDKKRDSRTNGIATDGKPKPNPARVREWTDRTGSFHVRAEFLGLKDNKMHLHKEDNGVQIAVLVSKMSLADLEYVESVTGQSLDEDKPLSDIKRRSTQRRGAQKSLPNPRPHAGAAVEHQKPKYDWFDFFLQCGVNPQICERYTAAFDRDQMGEENMQDISPTLLRTLGLKEGDILRVVKTLDQKFGRSSSAAEADDPNGGIFSGTNGALKNNRKSRPAPATANNDTVDPRAFEQNAMRGEKPAESIPLRTSSAVASPTSRSAPSNRANGSFEDDAWNVKPAAQSREAPRLASPTPTQNIVAPAPQKPAPTGTMDDLSLLSLPLQPTPTAQPMSQPQSMQQQAQQPLQQQQQLPPQPTGADRSFFDQLAQTQGPPPMPMQQQQTSMSRQRPQPPSQTQAQSSLLPPPPPPGRSLSAPQNQQASAFGPPPLQPQMTGYQQQQQQLAPPGHSLNDLSQQRYQRQQYQQPQMQQMQPQQTGYPMSNNQPQQNQYAPMQQPQQTGFYPQQQQQPYLQAQPTASPFADPPRLPFQPLQSQQTGYQPQAQFQYPQRTGASPVGPINNYLPPPLQPQPTGLNGFGGIGPQPTGFAGGQEYAQQQAPPPLPRMPPMPQQTTPAPLQPQKTGPAPPVRFGTTGGANKLVPQPTGRANLANATPQNPFGF